MLATFTNRVGGVSKGAYSSLNLGDHVDDSPSDVMANRKIVQDLYGPIQFMNQVHGNRIAVIEGITPDAPTADALITGIPGITLAVMVADCIPLLLISREVVAAVHVGRRGLVNEVALKTLQLMREMGAGDISAKIGPAICGRCYEVSSEIYDEVVSHHPLARSQTSSGTPALDLSKALSDVLLSAGIKTVLDQNFCTLEDQNFFSYRRDGVTGRQAGLVSL